ncbi:hypothetical protein HNP29_004348 [Pseudomonas alcaligenes]|nr:hypothetical protein [Pseudomonas alcaligenes]
MNDSEPSNASSPTLEELLKKIEQERNAREIALISQEHRLLPAIGNLAKAWTHPDPHLRSELLPNAVKALLWCLIPKPVTTGISFIALASLALAFWQTKLLSDQTDQLNTQNILVDAQRASSAMSNSPDIFRDISSEKINAPKCNNRDIKETCWSSTEWGISKFRPSQAVTDRIVTLTNLLQPYRYLTEDPEPCETDIFGRLDTILIASVTLSSRTEAPLTNLKDVRDKLKSLFSRNDQESITARTARILNSLSPFRRGSSQVPHISCFAGSPERGTLLMMLHSNRVDVSFLNAQHANFDYSVLPEVIDGSVISGLNASNLNLQNTSIAGTVRKSNIFRPSLGRYSLDDTIIENSFFPYASIPLNALNAKEIYELAQRNILDNTNVKFLIYDQKNRSNAFDLICEPHRAHIAKSPTNTPSLSVLTEVRKNSKGTYDMRGAFTMTKIVESGLIGAATDDAGPFEIYLTPLSQCNAAK